MKTIAFALAVAAFPLIGGSATAAAPDIAIAATSGNEAARPIDSSARKKVRRHRHVSHSHRDAYGYDRPYGAGYYRGVRPGWGYGPDPGDYAWPPFHFKPYW
jgi:hypothetical protein